MTNPIWWCTRHQSSVNPYDDDDSQCIVATCVVGVMSQCLMVEMRLVSADVLGDILWQFNEAVSLLREVRGSVMVPADVHEIDEALPAMQSALEALAAAQVGDR